MKAYYSPKTDLAVDIFNALMRSGDIELLPPNKEGFDIYAKEEMDRICGKIEEEFPFLKSYPCTFKENKHNKRDSKGRFKKTENWCEFLYQKQGTWVADAEVKQIRIECEDEHFITGYYRNGEYRSFRKDRIKGQITRWKE